MALGEVVGLAALTNGDSRHGLQVDEGVVERGVRRFGLARGATGRFVLAQGGAERMLMKHSRLCSSAAARYSRAWSPQANPSC